MPQLLRNIGVYVTFACHWDAAAHTSFYEQVHVQTCQEVQHDSYDQD